MRNRTRGKGIGFFETYGFYPDFILWIEKKDTQHILFVEPHGLAHVSERDKEKIELHKKIKELEEKLRSRTKKNIILDSFIISVTNYDFIKHIFNASKEDLKDAHILFMEDKCVENMLRPYIFNSWGIHLDNG